MVADAEELEADQPDVPVLDSVTQESPREEQQHESTSGEPWPPCLASGKPLTPIGVIAGQDGS